MIQLCVILLSLAASQIEPGDQWITLNTGQQQREYLLHIPADYNAAQPMPVVLVFHGAAMTPEMMAHYSSLSEKAEQSGFIVAYPRGTGIIPTWNSSALPQTMRADDVAFTSALIDDLQKKLNVDPARVYATGLSNGGMLCYLLADRLSRRIAAIASVGGTMGVAECAPARPVPVLHIHGTMDLIVPFGGPPENSLAPIHFCSVPYTIEQWVRADDCNPEPIVESLPDSADDGTTVTRTTYPPRNPEHSEVILITIEGGGHTWPGRPGPQVLLGLSTQDVNANDLIWDFFQQHPLPDSNRSQ